jgi:hypothetical protein
LFRGLEILPFTLMWPNLAQRTVRRLFVWGLDAIRRRIEVFRGEQPGFPYDRVTRSLGRLSIPSRQFPQHSRFDRRLNVHRVNLACGQTDAPERQTFVGCSQAKARGLES